MSVIQARAFFPTTGTAGNKPQKGEIRREILMIESIRLTIDELEQNTASDFWPFPTYGELLFA